MDAHKIAVDNVWNAFKNDDETQARAAIAAALAAFPDHERIYTRLIAACEKNLKPELALELTEAGLERFPENAFLHFAAARFHQSASPPALNKAIGHWEAALALKPKDARTHTQLGMAWLSQHESKKALQHLAAAIRLEPNNAWLYDAFGRGLLQDKNVEDAAEWYRKASQKFPDDAVLRNGLGAALFACGHYREAVNIANAMLDDLSEEQRGMALTLKNKALAKLYDSIAQDTPPVTALEHYLRADRLSRDGQWEDALFWLDRSEEDHTPDGPHHALKMALYKELGYDANALEEAEKLLALQPGSCRGWQMKAQCLLDFGNGRDALIAAQEAVSLQPNSRKALGIQAMAHLQLKQPKEALALADRLLMRESESLYGHGIAAKAYLLLDQPGAARKHLEISLMEQPDNRASHQLMVCVDIAEGKVEAGLKRLHRMLEKRFDPHAFGFLQSLAKNGIGNQSYEALFKTACRMNILSAEQRMQFTPPPPPKKEETSERQTEVNEVVLNYAQTSFYKKAPENFTPVDRISYHVKYNQDAPNVEGENLGYVRKKTNFER